MGSSPSHISIEPLLNERFSLLALEGYAISDQDNSSPAYYGYLNKEGAWYIMKATTTGAVVAYTYAKGSGSYNFAGRAGEVYASFSSTF
jgi:hypothetical protein